MLLTGAAGILEGTVLALSLLVDHQELELRVGCGSLLASRASVVLGRGT